MRVLLIALTLAAVGCATTPTPYQLSNKDKDGYSDKNMDSLLRVATFKGNSATKKETAELYAKFRAIEICKEMGNNLTHILLVRDNTYSKEISQTTANGPSYYYGMSPYYGHYGAYGAGMGGGYGYGTVTTTTSNDTYTYPMFDVYFECVDKPLDAGISLINLSSSQMKTIVKDLQGAVQVDAVLDESPNKGKIEKGDIVVKANGERVEKIIDVYHMFRKPSISNYQVELYRNGVKKTVPVAMTDVTEKVAAAQKEIIKEACKAKELKDTNKLCK
jgi:hypothetical protein